MKTQLIPPTTCILVLFSLAPQTSASPSRESIPGPDRDFYAGDAELGEELSAPRPAGVVLQSLPEIDADEFETSFKWFLA